MKYLECFDSAAMPLCHSVRDMAMKLPIDIKESAREIRLRAGKPLCISTSKGEVLVDLSGRVYSHEKPGIKTISREEIEETFNSICDYSAYSYREEISSGFVTIDGGHRAGLCGSAVVKDGKITALKDISSISIRISRDIKGASTELFEALYQTKTPSCLIAGPPGSGKTTILRDLIRRISYNNLGGIKISVIDERGEIAAMCDGYSQNDLGPYTDVFNAYPKALGIEIATRCFSPNIIICDELGGKEETESILTALNGGVKFISTAHAESISSLMRKENIVRLVEARCFDFVVVLGNSKTPCEIKEIISVEEIMCENSRTDNRSELQYSCGNISFSKNERKNKTYTNFDADCE